MVIPCAGTNQDGELQSGLSHSYTDNGDGTITDNRTSLMWEKLSDDDSVHDKDMALDLLSVWSIKIAGLNSANFAGHNDWRLPNINELQSLVDFDVVFPAIGPVFNNGCIFGCTVTTCSCTKSGNYWSTTTYRDSPSNAWMVYFDVGRREGVNKGLNYFSRAVRGGL